MSQGCAAWSLRLTEGNVVATARAILIAEVAILGSYKDLRFGVVRLNIKNKSVLTLPRRERILHIYQKSKKLCKST